MKGGISIKGSVSIEPQLARLTGSLEIEMITQEDLTFIIENNPHLA